MRNEALYHGIGKRNPDKSGGLAGNTAVFHLVFYPKDCGGIFSTKTEEMPLITCSTVHLLCLACGQTF
jgi:hypothetical protein